MTFSNVLAAIAVFLLFSMGLSQMALPAYQAWNQAQEEMKTVQAIRFLDQSFRKECASPSADLSRWKQDAGIIDGFYSCEITELKKDGLIVAYKAVCLLAGERLELIAERQP